MEVDKLMLIFFLGISSSRARILHIELRAVYKKTCIRRVEGKGEEGKDRGERER